MAVALIHYMEDGYQRIAALLKRQKLQADSILNRYL
jgi:hypothetical protein